MKAKLFVLIMLFALGYQLTNAQPFKKGNTVFNLAIGFGGNNNWGYKVSILPVSAIVEYGIVDGIFNKGAIGVGGSFAFASYKDNGLTDNYYTFNRMAGGIRAAFHYPFAEKLDTYLGLMAGYSSYKYKWHGSGTSTAEPGSGGFQLSGYFGGRYYFAEKFAATLELGNGMTYLNLGVAYKL